MLKLTWTAAVRLAFLEAPIAASTGVMQVPMFWPMMIGKAMPQVTNPAADSAWRIPIDAAEDWMAAVTKVPTRMPITGFWKVANIEVNHGSSRSGSTAASIENIPEKRMPMPIMIAPALRTRSRLAPI